MDTPNRGYELHEPDDGERDGEQRERPGAASNAADDRASDASTQAASDADAAAAAAKPTPKPPPGYDPDKIIVETADASDEEPAAAGAADDTAADAGDELPPPPAIGPTHPLYQVGSTVASIMVCAIVVVELFLAMLAMALVAPLAAGMANEFDVTLPWFTTLLLSIPPMVTFGVIVTLIVAVLVKEWLIVNKRLTLIINLALLLASLIWAPLLIWGVIQPLAEVLRSME